MGHRIYIQCWRSRSRSPSQRLIFTPIVWMEDREYSASISIFNRDRQDRDLDLRSFPRRSNNARVVSCCACKFRCYIKYRCIVCIIAAMCNIQCRAICCVIAGTTALLLSVLVFSCEVGVVKSALLVCQDAWRQYSYGVYRVCCMLSVLLHVVCEGVSQITEGMQVRLRMHDACSKPN